MAVGTLGTAAATTLAAVTFNPQGTATGTSTLTAADLAAISNSILGDGHFAGTRATGFIGTGSTHTNTTLDVLAYVSGGPLATINIGDVVLVVDATTRAFIVPPGTFVVAKPTGTSILMSQAATTTAALAKVAIVDFSISARFSFNGQLELPGGRGTVVVKPGDVVGLDSTGWPILVSANSIAYAGSMWTKA